MEIYIRKADLKDFPNIFQLIQAHAAYNNRLDKVTNSLKQMIAEKDFFNCLVAEDEEGDIVGIAVYSYTYFSWQGKSLYVDDLFVKEGYRRKGIGDLLMNNIIDKAKDKKCNLIVIISSKTNNDAKEFYSKYGAEINTEYDNIFIDISEE